MDSFGGFGAARDVEVDVLTDSYRVSGTVQTRFGRVTDIVNQHAGSHLTLRRATFTEHADPSAAVEAPSALVSIGSILLLTAPSLTGQAGQEMRIHKTPVRVELAIPPLRVTGIMHVPPGSVPAEGLLNMSDRFLAVTDATVVSGAFPQLAFTAAAVAVCRDRAHVLVVADEEQADEQLAEVLDQATAETWLNGDPAAR
jgi:hypothetical protein